MPPHAVSLCGEPGVGLMTAALYITSESKITPEVVYPERQDTVDMEKGTITIDIIRRLYQSTRSKVANQRFIVITKADTMSHEAQNAFLKLLEEPTPHTSFILLVHDSNMLLPTVKSRLQQCLVRSLQKEQTELLLDSLQVTNPTLRQQLLFIAAGRPALLTRLVKDKEYFESEAELLRQARLFVQGSLYERLVICHSVKDSREKAIRLTQYAMTILRFDIVTRHVADTAILELLDRLEEALARLAGNANIRLALAKAVL